MAEADIDQQIRETLDSLGVQYEELACDPEFADTARFCERYGVPLRNACNTIVVASRKDPRQYAACLVTATTRLDVNRTVRKLMGVRKLSFAGADETRELTGQEIGGVTAFGLPDDLTIYVDERTMELDYLILGGGSRTWKIKLAPVELYKLSRLEVVEGLAKEATDRPA